MPDITCKKCGNLFYAKPNWILKGSGKYCSIKCCREDQKNGRFFSCFVCKKQVYRSLKYQTRSKSGKFFCGKSCQATWRNTIEFSGMNHANWKGGRASYKSILRKSSAKQQCKKCNALDKRVLAVHHMDKNRKNNSVSNLIWLCHNCHYLVHHHKEESKGFLVPVA